MARMSLPSMEMAKRMAKLKDVWSVERIFCEEGG